MNVNWDGGRSVGTIWAIHGKWSYRVGVSSYMGSNPGVNFWAAPYRLTTYSSVVIVLLARRMDGFPLSIFSVVCLINLAPPGQ